MSLSPKKIAWIICIIGSLICIGLMQYKSEAEKPGVADAAQYMAGAYNLHHYGIYSQNLINSLNVTPEVGREPGFPFVTSLLMKLDLFGIGSLGADCIYTDHGCSPELFKSVQLMNKIFFAISGICLFWSVFIIFGSLKLAIVGGSSIWLNLQMQKNMDYAISDPFALLIVSLINLVFVASIRTKNKNIPAIGVGLLFGALILTKAIFLFFLYLAIIIAFFVFVIPRSRRALSGMMIPMLLFVFCAGIGPMLWMKRNFDISGDFALSDSRSGIALSTRVVFNEMTPQQYAASFVYWTRGFGDNLAKKIFPKEVWGPFDDYVKDGFYDRGQFGFQRIVDKMVKDEGLSDQAAEDKHTTALMRSVLTQPITHAIVTLPMIYRGIWVDLFAWISVPALFVLLCKSVKRKDVFLLILLSPAIFNLVFYALVSLNIPRYQITAAPAFTFGLVFFFILVGEWRKKRKSQKLKNIA